MKKINKISEVKKMTAKESLLGLGIVLMAAGTTALQAGQYTHGCALICASMAILYFRGFVKNGKD